MHTIPALFATSILAQVPTIPATAGMEETWKWAAQTGGFGALFTVLVWISLRWLAGRFDTYSAEIKQARESEIEALKGVIKTNSDLLTRVLIALEHAGHPQTK